MSENGTRDIFEDIELGSVFVGILLLVIHQVLMPDQDAVLILGIGIIGAAVGLDEAHNWVGS